MKRRLHRRRSSLSVLPGFGLSFGLMTAYLSFIVIIPLAAIFIRVAGVTFSEMLAVVSQPRVLAAFRLTMLCSLAAAVVNALFGLLVAWVLTRYRFAGRGMLNALIDLPFALPTSVTGIALTTLYARKGLLGAPLELWGIRVAYTQLGIFLALVFIGLPFVVRTVQPILEDLDTELEEAAATLGASAWQTFSRVILPVLWPAVLSGFSLAFARGLGEYGSVIFISGNLPMKTEIISLLIMVKLEEFQYGAAATLGFAMLLVSFALLLVMNTLPEMLARGRRRA